MNLMRVFTIAYVGDIPFSYPMLPQLFYLMHICGCGRERPKFGALRTRWVESLSLNSSNFLWHWSLQKHSKSFVSRENQVELILIKP